jgi:hypothetical protein
MALARTNGTWWKWHLMEMALDGNETWWKRLGRNADPVFISSIDEGDEVLANTALSIFKHSHKMATAQTRRGVLALYRDIVRSARDLPAGVRDYYLGYAKEVRRATRGFFYAWLHSLRLGCKVFWGFVCLFVLFFVFCFLLSAPAPNVSQSPTKQANALFFLYNFKFYRRLTIALISTRARGNNMFCHTLQW